MASHIWAIKLLVALVYDLFAYIVLMSYIMHAPLNLYYILFQLQSDQFWRKYSYTYVTTTLWSNWDSSYLQDSSQSDLTGIVLAT
jgi:hypothetical protein